MAKKKTTSKPSPTKKTAAKKAPAPTKAPAKSKPVKAPKPLAKEGAERYHGARVAYQILLENGNKKMRQRDIVGELSQRVFGDTSKSNLRRAMLSCNFYGPGATKYWVKVEKGWYKLTDKCLAATQKLAQ